MQYITQQEKKQKTIKTILSLLVGILVLGLAIWGIVYMAQQDSGISYLPPSLSEITEDEYVLGNRNAALTLIEYGDFQCPACRAFAPMVKQLNQDFPDQLRIVFRHFPLPQHKNGYPSSYAVEAAGKQGKFWEMVEKVYSDQDAWASMVDPQARFESYIDGLGLNTAQFVQDYNDQGLRNKVKAHKESGDTLGVNSTPTFFLNGQKISNPATYEQFKELVKQAVQ